MNSHLTRICLTCLILYIWFQDCKGQPAPKRMNYTTLVRTSGGAKTKGILLEVGDSSIQIYSRESIKRIPASTIDRIKIKRTAAAGSGALIGSAVGLVAGGIVGFASGDEDPSQSWYSDPVTAEEKALMLGIAFSFGGALVGTIIGSASQVDSFTINGDQQVFLTNAEKIRKYANSSRH